MKALSPAPPDASPYEASLKPNGFAAARGSLAAHLKLILMGYLGFLLLSSMAGTPWMAVLLLDILLCVYLAGMFQSRYRMLFFLHPLILLVSSRMYVTPFLNAGDGDAYVQVVAQYLDTQNLILDTDWLKGYGLLTSIRYMNMGVAPVLAVPDFFFSNPQSPVYYLWQGTFHTALCAIVITLARAWRIIGKTELLGASPTRHVVTFFGVFLLFAAHLATVQKFTPLRAIWLAAALLVVLVSRPQLLIPYLVFAMVDLFFIRKIKAGWKFGLLALLFVAVAVMARGFVTATFLDYENISKIGAGANSGLTRLPVIGWAVKYVFALLAPFPWSKAPFFVATIYSGNWLLFFMHVLSSLIGMYLAFVIILRWRAIWASGIELKTMVAFALIMSLSILKGTTGFHTYLLIYFPMLAPLLVLDRFRINPLLPLGFVCLLEVVLGVGG
jgi:hypothetical protein